MKAAPRIKICGLRDAATIEAMDGLPIDEIGLMFAPSKRQVGPEEAARLAEAIRTLKAKGDKPPRIVGVFVNAGLADVRAVLATAPLDVVQLHGGETPETCQAIRQELNIDVWKVFSIKDETRADRLTESSARLAPYKNAVDAVLIDTAGGGTGKTFDWSAIDDYKQAASEIGAPLYIAGGLHAGNVGELLSRYSPDGIDVSSGVETDGRKDIDKIRLFVGKVIEA